MSVGVALLVGQLVINVPVFLIIIGGIILAIFALAFEYYLLSLILIFLGPLIAWLWWSFMVPRWRRWAHKRVVDPNKLQKLAVATALVWPKGSILEKTEFKLKDDDN